ncbi:NAD(P)-binding protein [Aspergillus aculeatinus CBS 121060]|uniref:NAD(P)-binding protein n=1 Tax=Aspergillus aculeatinus CBS 121060 TaxID=1448322 RepID=A0ACD1HGD1_9EURO|nr:NAD(P)-binding protein [Aspergillus aculeatinus CBS 121060]RAH72476.1 NAD(P)-binding protein [Aspergillus aculeatinus CBS 121060]
MPSYLITGASRGLGQWEFLRQISSDPKNTVIELVRDKPATEKRVMEELESPLNMHILQADITDYNSLQAASAQTALITGGGLDYLIANAGYVSKFDAYDGIGVLGEQPEALEEDLTHGFRVNVLGNIHLFNIFLPLILQGEAKKVIAISTGVANLSLIPKYNVEVASLYAISKAGLNTAVAKFSAQYAKKGVLFMSICPGMVETGHFTDATPEQMRGLAGMLTAFREYAPHFRGPSTPEAAERDVLSVMHRASVQNGNGGTFVSHDGTQQFL